jgi:hypothetical protein
VPARDGGLGNVGDLQLREVPVPPHHKCFHRFSD